jgi:hypothetical protein
MQRETVGIDTRHQSKGASIWLTGLSQRDTGQRRREVGVFREEETNCLAQFTCHLNLGPHNLVAPSQALAVKVLPE